MRKISDILVHTLYVAFLKLAVQKFFFCSLLHFFSFLNGYLQIDKMTFNLTRPIFAHLVISRAKTFLIYWLRKLERTKLFISVHEWLSVWYNESKKKKCEEKVILNNSLCHRMFSLCLCFRSITGNSPVLCKYAEKF